MRGCLQMIQKHNWQWIASASLRYEYNRNASVFTKGKIKKPANILSTLSE